MSQTESQVLTTPQTRTFSRRVADGFRGIQILDAIVFLVYAAVLGVTISKHEPWFDEAQAWLLARDSSLFTLLWERLRYEGHPGLWYVILWLANIFHAPYYALNLIGGVCAAAGVLVWLRLSPFPRFIRYAVPFSFFLLYQFAVVSRSYVLMPLLVFLAAHWFTKFKSRTYSLLTVLSLLAMLSVHGTIISSSLVLVLAIRSFREWKSLDRQTKRRLVGSLSLFLLVIAAVAVELYPPHDLYLGKRPKLEEVGKLNYVLDFFGRAFVGSPLRTLPVLALTIYLFIRHRVIGIYLIPTVLLLLLATVVWASPWHQGTLVLVWLMTLWIVWPKLGRWPNPETLMITAAIALVLLIQIRWSWLSVKYDLANAYSGSKATAEYLKSIGAERLQIYAFDTSQTTSLLPYFPTNIIANFPYRELGSAWRWTTQGRTPLTLEKIQADRPGIVLYCLQEPATELTAQKVTNELTAVGYDLKARFDGQLFYTSHIVEPESFLVFALRNGPPEGAVNAGRTR